MQFCYPFLNVSYPFWVIKSYRFSGIFMPPSSLKFSPKLQALILAPLMKARSCTNRSAGFLFFDGKKKTCQCQTLVTCQKLVSIWFLSGFFYVIVFYKFVCWINWIHVQVIGLQGHNNNNNNNNNNNMQRNPRYLLLNALSPLNVEA